MKKQSISMNVEKPSSFLKTIRLADALKAESALCFIFENATEQHMRERLTQSVAKHKDASILKSLIEALDFEKPFSSQTLGSAFLCLLNRKESGSLTSHQGQLEESLFTFFRERAGHVTSLIQNQKFKSIGFVFSKLSNKAVTGFLTGLEIAHYQFLQTLKQQRFAVDAITVVGATTQQVTDAQAIGESVNLARHLVNLPPNILNPKSYAEFITQLFSSNKSVTVSQWQDEKLLSEGLGLLEAVGRGAEFGPRLLKLKYTPKKTKAKDPIALIGKGITFDSGGLDIKPSSGMRLMKKDMGGSASVLGVFHWAAVSGFDQPLIAYLAIAENAVSKKSFHPSDVIEARNGTLVEIHNTDAEGRLVLADALDMACDDKPRCLIDVATLTGAMRVGLGTEIAGLFSNSDELASKIQKAGQLAGDLNWRMPLYVPYAQNFSSPFADLVNAVDSMGGAITAALFLERFVRNLPWAHLDAYCWSDKALGSLRSAGGSGQTVQCLIEFLQMA